MKEVEIYKKTYFVEENEMNIKKHDEYNNLKIITDLSILEREIGLFQELLNLTKNGNMMEISPTHGGYIANTDIYHNLYFLQTDPSHLSNIKKNLSHLKIIKIFILNIKIQTLFLRMKRRRFIY